MRWSLCALSTVPAVSVIVLFAGLASSVHAGPQVLFVDDDAPPGGDGSSWAAAHRHLQDALSAAGAAGGVEIRVAQGVYWPDRSAAAPAGTGQRLAAFLLGDGVMLLGGHAGLGAADPDARDPARFPSVLSGDLAGNDDPADPATFADNAYHVVESWHNDATAVVDGFTVRAGRADRPVGEGWWPARRDDSGGGALLVHSDAVFRHCRFTDNHADANGHLFIALSGPFAFAEPGGGAVFISRGSPTIESCVFDANSANRIGGALSLHRSPARVVRSVFTGNAVLNDGYGGALGDMSGDFSTPERARVESCRFVANTALGMGGGGAIYTGLTDTVYANCVLLANHAENDAGGVYADNVAFVEFHNTAIVGNTSERRAAGVYEFSEVGDSYQFINCVVWANRTADPIEPLNQNMVSVNGNVALYDTILEDAFTRPVAAYETVRLFDADPVFTDPVGPDGQPFSGDENLRPAPGSPAIDAGDSSRLPSWLTADLDARPRRIDAPAPDTGVGPAPIVDIGPYEAGPGCSPADLAEPFGVVDVFDLLAFVDAYAAGSPAADLAPPTGRIDLFDLLAFLDLYAAGCP